jgi:hypothetical protein
MSSTDISFNKFTWDVHKLAGFKNDLMISIPKKYGRFCGTVIA